MATNLTNVAIKDGFSNLLHLDGGLTSSEKLIYDGDGTVGVVQFGTTSASVTATPSLANHIANKTYVDTEISGLSSTYHPLGGSSTQNLIAQNLTVHGTTITKDSQQVNIGDAIIVLNAEETGTPSENAGFEIERGTSTNTSVRWNESTDRFQFTNNGTTYYDIPISTEYDVTPSWVPSSDPSYLTSYTNTMGDGFRLVDIDSNVAVIENKWVKFKTVSGGTGFGNIARGSGTEVSPWEYELSYTDTTTNTQNTYASSWVDSSTDVLLRLTGGGATSGTQDIKIVKGANITLTPSGTDMTIAATNTNQLTKFRLRDDADADVYIAHNQYIKFDGFGGIVTAWDETDALGTTGDPHILKITSSNTGTVTSIATSGAITGGTITGTGTISHLTTAGNKHIPTLGASGQYLKYTSSGTAVWATPGYAFGTVVVAGQTNVVADSESDTLTLVGSTNVTITTDAELDKISFSSLNTTYTSSDFDHDSLTNFLAAEHLDWTTDQGLVNIHSGNYLNTYGATTFTVKDNNAPTTRELSHGEYIQFKSAETGSATQPTFGSGTGTSGSPFDLTFYYTDTTYTVSDGGLTQNNFTNTLKTKLDGIETSATADQDLSGYLSSSSSASQLTDIYWAGTPANNKILKYNSSTGAFILADLTTGDTTWVFRDNDGDSQTIEDGKYVKFIEGGNIDINWSGGTGAVDDEWDLTFTATNTQCSVTDSVSTTDSAVRASATAVKSAYDRSWSTLAIGSSSSTAHRGDLGATAYTHSQATHAPTGAEANVSGNSGNAAVYDNSGTPTLKSGITATEMRTTIGAGTSSLVVGTSGGTALEGDTTIIALGATSSTAYRGDRGTTAYDHSQAAHAPSNANNYSLPSTVIHESELSNATDNTSTTVAANLAGVKSAYDRAWAEVDHTHSAYAAVSHSHSYLPLGGGNLTGHVNLGVNYGLTGSSAPDYSEAMLELQTSSNYVPAIGFHRGGYSATTLYENDGELYVNAWTTRSQSGKLLSSGNWSTYAASASHTHTIAQIGAGTLTASTIHTYQSNDAIDSASGSQAPLQVYQDNAGADAFMTFHVEGDYALYFGLAGDTNELSVGGWSFGASKAVMLHANNYSSYANFSSTALTAGTGTFSGNLTLSSLTGIVHIGTRFRLYADNSNAVGWIGVGSNLNTVKIGDADFTNSLATFSLSAGITAFQIIKDTNAFTGYFYNDNGTAQGLHIKCKSNDAGQTGRYLIKAEGYGSSGAFSNNFLVDIDGNTTVAGSVSTGAGVSIFDAGSGDTHGVQVSSASSNYTNNLLYVTKYAQGASANYSYFKVYNATDTEVVFDLKGDKSATFAGGITVNGESTFTDIVYFNKSTNPAYVYGEFNTGASDSKGLQIYSSGGAGASMAFHRGGYFAVNMGLDSDNVFRIGGWSASSNRLQLDMDGNLTVAGDVTAYSDIRLKENIHTIDNALDKVLSMRGVYYNRIDSSGGRKIGVIAQEIMPIIPEVVGIDNEGMYNVSYGNINAVLIEAIKELKNEINQLKGINNG